MNTKTRMTNLLVFQFLLIVGYLCDHVQAGPIVRRSKALRIANTANGFRSLEDEFEANNTPCNGSSSFRNESTGENAKYNIVNVGFLLPLVSMSCALWLVRKHGRTCCSSSTVFDDTESIPSQIVISQDRSIKENAESIELQNVMTTRLQKNHPLQDPVDNLSMLNHSDWAEDEESEDLSFSWLENGSTTIGYYNMKD